MMKTPVLFRFGSIVVYAFEVVRTGLFRKRSAAVQITYGHGDKPSKGFNSDPAALVALFQLIADDQNNARELVKGYLPDVFEDAFIACRTMQQLIMMVCEHYDNRRRLELSERIYCAQTTVEHGSIHEAIEKLRELNTTAPLAEKAITEAIDHLDEVIAARLVLARDVTLGDLTEGVYLIKGDEPEPEEEPKAVEIVARHTPGAVRYDNETTRLLFHLIYETSARNERDMRRALETGDIRSTGDTHLDDLLCDWLLGKHGNVWHALDVQARYFFEHVPMAVPVPRDTARFAKLSEGTE